MASASRSAVPRKIQCSGSTFPLRSSTITMNEGRSRDPVRSGYRYIGHW